MAYSFRLVLPCLRHDGGAKLAMHVADQLYEGKGYVYKKVPRQLKAAATQPTVTDKGSTATHR